VADPVPGTQRSKVLECAIHQWAVDRGLSFMHATAVHQLAVMSEPVYQILEWLRDRRGDRHLPPRPPVKDWLKLYRGHRRLWRVAGDLWPGPYGDGQGSQALASAWRDMSRLARRDRKEFAGWLSAAEPGRWKTLWHRRRRKALREYRDHLREVRAFLKGEPTGDEESAEFGRQIRCRPELHFMLTVTMPCIIEYGLLPVELLRRARSGDERAIERAIRLDPTTADDLRVAAWRNGGDGAERRRRVDLVALWTREGVGGKFSVEQAKVVFAGLVAAVSEVLGFVFKGGKLVRVRLTSNDIWELFGAVAQDRGKGFGAAQADADLAQLYEPESWKTLVSRKKRAWQRNLPVTVNAADVE
jgi:hypothetical protein